jgi:hypothetical protein
MQPIPRGGLAESACSQGRRAGGGGARLALQHVDLEVVVLEHLERLVLGHLNALERVLALHHLVERLHRA